MNEVILKAESPLAVYNEFRQQLEQLKADNAAVVFDYETPQGSSEARSHVYKLRKTKGAVEKARKEAKAESLRYGRVVDSEAKELTADIEGMIEVHAKPLREIEEREAERKQRHLDRIAFIQQTGAQTESPEGTPISAKGYQLVVDYLEKVSIEDAGTWEEFEDKAKFALITAIDLARLHLKDRTKYESEQEELARLRLESEERDAKEKKEADERAEKERENQLRREGEERAQKEAEQKRKEAENKREAERKEAENRELQLKLAVETSEREKVEAEQRAEQAEKDAKEKAERAVKENAIQETEAAAKREANKRHRAKINNEALDCLVAGGIDTDVARSCITLIAEGKVHHVKIAY